MLEPAYGFQEVFQTLGPESRARMASVTFFFFFNKDRVDMCFSGQVQGHSRYCGPWEQSQPSALVSQAQETEVQVHAKI